MTTQQTKHAPQLTLRRIASYAVLATITAPITVPAAWIGYQAYRMARWAFTRPNASLAVVAGAALLLYADQRGCSYRHTERPTTRTAITLPVDAARTSPTTALEDRVRERTQSEQETAAVLRDEQSYFYFVQPGESTAELAQRYVGDAGYAQTIAAANGVCNRQLVAGERLRLRRSACRRTTAGLYAQVPDLASVVLSPGEGIRERFGPRTDAVIALNKLLGLPYDRFTGERVVWYEK